MGEGSSRAGKTVIASKRWARSMGHSTEGLGSVSPSPVKSVQSLGNREFRVGLRVWLDGVGVRETLPVPAFFRDGSVKFYELGLGR